MYNYRKPELIFNKYTNRLPKLIVDKILTEY